MTPGGLPHSGIRGSTLADSSPRLFAAIHALLRLVAPRHPPCALRRSAPRDAPCRANRIELNLLTPPRSSMATLTHFSMRLLMSAAQGSSSRALRRIPPRLLASDRSTHRRPIRTHKPRSLTVGSRLREATKNRSATEGDRPGALIANSEVLPVYRPILVRRGVRIVVRLAFRSSPLPGGPTSIPCPVSAPQPREAPHRTQAVGRLQASPRR